MVDRLRALLASAAATTVRPDVLVHSQGFDFGEARFGIARDVGELLATGPVGWLVAALVFTLPLASLVAALKGRRLALVPLAMSLVLFSEWVLHYATDWFANPGMAGLHAAVLFVLLAWGVLALAIVRPWRARTASGSARARSS